MRTKQQNDRRDYIVILRPESGLDADEELRCLRRFLKAALRAYRMQCVTIKPRIEPEPHQTI